MTATALLFKTSGRLSPPSSSSIESKTITFGTFLLVENVRNDSASELIDSEDEKRRPFGGSGSDDSSTIFKSLQLINGS
jgi:hypothetical protein